MMVKIGKKRLLALSVAICLIISLLPINSFCADANFDTSDVYAKDTECSREMPAADGSLNGLKFIDAGELEKFGAVRRLIDKETLNSYVFLNSDGTESVIIFPENIKYCNEFGEIIEKDTALVELDSRGYTVAANDYKIIFPNEICDGLYFEYLDGSITITPENAEGELLKEENSIVYVDVFGENTLLRYTPLIEGVKEDIVLYDIPSKSTFDFILNLDHLTLSENEENIVLCNEKKEPIIRFGEVLAYDSEGKTVKGSVTVTQKEYASTYAVTINVPEEFLMAPSTVYPVTIDPTIYENTDGTYIQDAPVFSMVPDTNYGSNTYNSIGITGIGAARTAVRLYGLEINPIYRTLDAEEIVSVKFSVREASGNAGKYVNLFRISSSVSWTESTVTYNNVGSFDTTVNNGGYLYSGDRTDFDITSFAKGWKNNSYTNTMRIVFTMSGGEFSSLKQFDSSECAISTNRPYIVFTYQIKNLMNEGTYYIRNKHIDKFLQPTNGSSSINAGLELYDFSGNNAQKWEITSNGNGFYTIKSVQSNYVLSVPSGSYSTYDVQLIQTTDTQADGQQWRIYMTSYCGFAIKPKSACGPNNGSGWSDRTMSVADGNDGNGALVTQRPYVYNNSFKDEWYLVPTDIPTSGGYSITNKQLSSCIQPEGTPESSNWSLALYSPSGLTAQKWHFESVGGGYYKISPYAYPSYAITVASGHESTENGSILLQTYSSSSSRQQWLVYRVPNGFVFKARSSGLNNLVLSVSEGNLGDGAVVSQREYVNNLSYKEEWLGFTPSGTETNASSANKTYFVRNKATGLFLTQNYPNASLSSYSGDLDQKWQFQNNNDGTVRLVSLSENTPTSGDNRYVLYSLSASSLCISPGSASIIPDLKQEWIIEGTNPNTTIKSKEFSTYLGVSASASCLLQSENDYSRWELIECSNPYVLPSISNGDFTTEKYNSGGTDGLLHRMNCYSYALGYYGEYAESIRSNEYKEVQPGSISGTGVLIDLTEMFNIPNTYFFFLSPLGIDLYASSAINAINSDLQVLFDDASTRVFPSTADEIMTGPWKKVALVLNTTAVYDPYEDVLNGFDYHWYVEHNDGFWSHKLGLTNARTLDASGLLIEDPQFCNRSHACDYDYFVGYFKIKIDSIPDDYTAFDNFDDYDSAGDVSSMAYNIGVVHHGFNNVYDTRHAKIEYLTDASSYYAEDYLGDIPVVNTFDWPADSDWFEFMVETSGTYAIFSGGNGIDTYGILLRDDVIIAEDDDSGNGFNFYMSVSLDAGQLYKICVASSFATDEAFDYWINFD